MATEPLWQHTLQASKREVILAVDLYNRSGEHRHLEAFVVHMNMGWLKLVQARAEEQGGDLLERDKSGLPVEHPEGGYKYKPLRTLLPEAFDPSDPRVANILFFVGLRNRIEHRHEGDIAALVAGRTQALLINYEETLVEFFGKGEALGSELRFPLFVSSITEDAVVAVKSLRKRVPRGILEWIQDYDTSLDAGISDDQRFEFRIFLIPHTGPKSTADAAMTFVRASDLSPEQNDVMDQVRTIIRDKKVPVEDLHQLLPKAVVDKVAPRINRPFTIDIHTRSWKYFGVRPDGSAANKSATKSDFCRYNEAFSSYVYTPQWVEYLVRHLANDETYDAIMSGEQIYGE